MFFLFCLLFVCLSFFFGRMKGGCCLSNRTWLPRPSPCAFQRMPLYVLCLEGGKICMYKLEVELKSQKHPSEHRVSPTS